MCGAAGMLLKGEGTVNNAVNASEAVRLYEEAAEMGSVRALNGLGYIYFYGQQMEKNLTKAFYYFLAAAETETDSDSLYNAGFCLQNGYRLLTHFFVYFLYICFFLSYIFWYLAICCFYRFIYIVIQYLNRC